MDEAEDVIGGTAKDRDARALGGGEEGHDVVEGGFDGKSVHIRTRDHDFADLELAEFDGAENKFFFAGSEETLFAGLLDLDLQFLRGVGEAVAGVRADAEGLDDGAGDAVEQIDGPAKGLEEPPEGPGDEKGDAFGLREADAFGDEFAEDNVNGAEEDEGEGESDGVHEEEHADAAFRGHDVLNEFGEGGFAERAESQAGEGDTELHARDDAVEIAEERFHDFCLGVALDDQLADAREADSDKRKFNGGEKAVQHHEHEHCNQAKQKHAVRESPSGSVAAERGSGGGGESFVDGGGEIRVVEGSVVTLAVDEERGSAVDTAADAAGKIGANAFGEFVVFEGLLESFTGEI